MNFYLASNPSHLFEDRRNERLQVDIDENRRQLDEVKIQLAKVQAKKVRSISRLMPFELTLFSVKFGQPGRRHQDVCIGL